MQSVTGLGVHLMYSTFFWIFLCVNRMKYLFKKNSSFLGYRRTRTEYTVSTTELEGGSVSQVAVPFHH